MDFDYGMALSYLGASTGLLSLALSFAILFKERPNINVYSDKAFVTFTPVTTGIDEYGAYQ